MSALGQSFTRCREGQTGANILSTQLGKIRQYLILAHAASEVLEDIVNCDSSPLDAWISTGHMRSFSVSNRRETHRLFGVLFSRIVRPGSTLYGRSLYSRRR